MPGWLPGVSRHVVSGRATTAPRPRGVWGRAAGPLTATAAVVLNWPRAAAASEAPRRAAEAAMRSGRPWRPLTWDPSSAPAAVMIRRRELRRGDRRLRLGCRSSWSLPSRARRSTPRSRWSGDRSHRACGRDGMPCRFLPQVGRSSVQATERAPAWSHSAHSVWNSCAARRRGVWVAAATAVSWSRRHRPDPGSSSVLWTSRSSQRMCTALAGGGQRTSAAGTDRDARQLRRAGTTQRRSVTS